MPADFPASSGNTEARVVRRAQQASIPVLQGPGASLRDRWACTTAAKDSLLYPQWAPLKCQSEPKGP